MTPYEYHEIKSLLIEINNKVSQLMTDWEKELLTPAEVCTMLKIGRTTYQRYVANGVFSQTRINGKVYVRRSDIMTLIGEGKL